MASDTKTKKRKTKKCATKQARSTGHSYSITKNKKSKSKPSSLPTIEITLKNFRKYFGCNDFFRNKIKFPNSNLPLPWMYVYVSVQKRDVSDRTRTWNKNTWRSERNTLMCIGILITNQFKAISLSCRG